METVFFNDSFLNFDFKEEFSEFCRLFKEVNAAGGIVEREDGKFLAIKRNGKWDIPKGHQESGEDIVQCAVREVEEETGLTGISAGELICITHHIYYRDDIWTLKHTWWYRMSWNGDGCFIPQKEEGISEVIWREKCEISAMLENTYGSIACLMKQFCKKSV